MTNRKQTVEVLPPEDPNTADSEQSRLAANYVLQAHRMTQQGSQMFAVGALACGFILLNEKARLPHGEFDKWQRKHLKPISRPTGKRYMQIAGKMHELQESKVSTVRHLLEGTRPSDLTENHIQRIAPMIQEITEGKTFTELGRELGIFKPRNTKSERARKRLAKRTGDAVVDAEHDATAWTDEVVALLARVDDHKDAINGKDLTRLATSMRETALSLGLMKIE